MICTNKSQIEKFQTDVSSARGRARGLGIRSNSVGCRRTEDPVQSEGRLRTSQARRSVEHNTMPMAAELTGTGRAMERTEMSMTSQLRAAKKCVPAADSLHPCETYHLTRRRSTTCRTASWVLQRGPLNRVAPRHGRLIGRLLLPPTIEPRPTHSATWHSQSTVSATCEDAPLIPSAMWTVRVELGSDTL
jgi:hypothetical protein